MIFGDKHPQFTHNDSPRELFGLKVKVYAEVRAASLVYGNDFEKMKLNGRDTDFKAN
jgi:hypothetical protein